MTLLVACGLKSEARIIKRNGRDVVVIAGGGDAVRLERELDALASGAALILSSGLAGALDPRLRVGDVVIGTTLLPLASSEVEKPGDPDSTVLDFARTERGWGEWLTSSLPDAKVGKMVSSAVPILSACEKQKLHLTTGALAVDMESAVAARVAARHGKPFAFARVISDSAQTTLPPAAFVGMRADGGIAIGAVLASIARNPKQVPALIRTARDASRALAVLGRLHDALGRSGIGRLDAGEFALDMR